MSGDKIGMKGYWVGLQIVPGGQAKASPPPPPSGDQIMIDGKWFTIRGDKAYDENGKEYVIEAGFRVPNAS